MNEQQIIDKIYPIYKVHGYDRLTFKSQLANIEQCYNDDVKRAFERASLRIHEADELKLSHPAVSNLLCYIAIETLANTIEYFKKTTGQENTDFIFKTNVEKKINKTNVFINFCNDFCPDDLKLQVRFKKYSYNNQANVYESDFKDFLRYLYTKNRCYIVHKGLFRLFEVDSSWGDIFIDTKGEKCVVSVNVGSNDWIFTTTTRCFINFLKYTSN